MAWIDGRLPAMSFVLGGEAEGERAAYPLAELKRSPVLHDRVGGRGIVIFTDFERDAAAVFEPMVDGH